MVDMSMRQNCSFYGFSFEGKVPVSLIRLLPSSLKKSAIYQYLLAIGLQYMHRAGNRFGCTQKFYLQTYLLSWLALISILAFFKINKTIITCQTKKRFYFIFTVIWFIFQKIVMAKQIMGKINLKGLETYFYLLIMENFL